MGEVEKELLSALRDLIFANHILHHHGAVDAYGHVSIRHPTNPSIYIMCGYMPPALVSSREDLVFYHVADSSPVDPDSQRGYSERFIHGEILKRFRTVNCVVHSHAEEVLPYVVTNVKLRAVYHMGGFLGSEGLKIFDIDTLYEPDERRDMLVNNSRFGAALAETFVSSVEAEIPEESVVLMRRHGFTCVGVDLNTTVYRAIYTRINAEAQTKAMSIARSSPEQKSQGVDVTFQGMTAEQSEGSRIMNEGTQDKPWRLWVREVQSIPLYKNVLAEI